MNKLIVLCMNEIPVGVYTSIAKAHAAQLEHEEKEEMGFPYEFHEFVVDAAAKR